MAKTISELRNQSIQVRDASAAGENTATRVGTVLNDIVGHIEDYENTQSSNNSSQDAKIEGVKSSLNAEIARAKTEESNLSTQIGTERTERQAAVSREETARIQADNDEKTARQQADNAEQDARIQADNDEKTARENADITLRTMIQTEVSNRQIAVKQEEIRAMAAEKANTQAIENEVARLDLTDNKIKADLEAETSRAKAAEEANAQAIAEEKAAIIGTDRIADGAVTLVKISHESVDDEPTAGSDNLVKSGGVANKLAELGKLLKDYDDENLYITDSYGNVIAKIGKDGLTSTRVNIKANQGKGVSFLDDYDDENLYITDSYGNVIAKIGKDGLTSTRVNIKANQGKGVSFLDDYDGDIYVTDEQGNIAFKILSNGNIDFNSSFVIMNSLYNKKIVGCGDSLSANGYYEKDLADIAGGIYKGVISIGGTFTIPDGKSTQDRVKSFVDKGADADVLILENVNDNWYSYLIQGEQMVLKGDIADKPFMLSQYHTPSVSYESASLAEHSFTNDFASIIAGVENKVKGTIISLPYTTSTIKISVNSGATGNGTIQVKLGSNTYSVEVTVGMTANQIASAINEYNFIGYAHSVSENVVTLTLQAGYTLDSVSFVTGSTGVTMSYTEATSTSYVRKAFMGHSVEEFSQIANWKTTKDISLYSYYKGIIEYLQTNCPALRIVWFIPTTWVLNFENPDLSYVFEDGSWDMHGIMTSGYNHAYYVRTTLLHQIQKEVCKYYGVECIDATEECGITPFNAQAYYNSENVHPKRITYTKWAEYLFNKLK